MNKAKIINFKAEEDVKIEFEINCKNNYKTPSAVLYEFVRKYNKQHKGNQILISQLKK